MVSAEPLVSPAVTLHDGLVTLAEPSPGRLYGELRRLLLRVAGGASTSDPGAADVEERCEAGLWCASTAALVHRHADGLSALLPLEPRSPGDAALLVELSAGLHAGADGAIPARLGRRAGLVGLWADGREWIIYWPSAAAPLWLCSTQRLPQVSDFRLPASGVDPEVVRLAASPGEALVALGRPLPSPLVAPTADEGAPSWLEAALHLLAPQPGFPALAIEALS
jgi:hypothetical protein